MKDTGESKEQQLTVALRIRPVSDAEREEAATTVAHRVDEQVRGPPFSCCVCGSNLFTPVCILYVSE
ncbi:Kinesin-like protein kif19 [Dissostichus eleginoides]|nr:Kinesin-like protein kif19 [Dissostichus eleginoides]